MLNVNKVGLIFDFETNLPYLLSFGVKLTLKENKIFKVLGQ